MSGFSLLTTWQQRLADELVDDGVMISVDDAIRHVVLEELDHCRRAPVFEGRQPTYGAMILSPDGTQNRRQALNDHIAFDVIPVDGDPMLARTYADGRSSYLVRDVEGHVALACFERSMLFEVDLVHLQQLTGGVIVQRTPVLDVVRIFVENAVISWDGRNWQSRPTAVRCETHWRRGCQNSATDWPTWQNSRSTGWRRRASERRS